MGCVLGVEYTERLLVQQTGGAFSIGFPVFKGAIVSGVGVF